MDESKEMAFAAIITITLPDSIEATELNVTLLPSDLVYQGDGSAKPLQDCTLGELLQFASNLEEEIWSGYRESNLLDLVIEGGAEIDFEVGDEATKESISQDFWLEHLIIIDDVGSDALSQEGKANAEEDSPESTEKLNVQSLSDEQTDLNTVQVTGEKVEEREEDAVSANVDETSPLEIEQVDLPEALQSEVDTADEVGEESGELVPEEVNQELITEPTDSDITVTEPELIHEVIEAEKEETEAIKKELKERPSLRILGRRRPLNHPTWTSVDILINEPAFRNTQAHALSSLEREVAGVLVGPPPEKQPDGRYVVHISDTIIAKHTRMHGASVTYTPESWRYINDKLAERYPDNEAVIIGWYHTHPGFGIFLSGMDQFIHQNFFTQSWHIALVLDPLARRSGFFCWDRELTKVDRYEFPWPEWAKNSW